MGYALHCCSSMWLPDEPVPALVRRRAWGLGRAKGGAELAEHGFLQALPGRRRPDHRADSPAARTLPATVKGYFYDPDGEKAKALKRAGATSADTTDPVGLTPRELEVLELLCDGLRNAEIAQRLVVSEKTVDHHVSADPAQARRPYARRGQRHGGKAGLASQPG